MAAKHRSKNLAQSLNRLTRIPASAIMEQSSI